MMMLEEYESLWCDKKLTVLAQVISAAQTSPAFAPMTQPVVTWTPLQSGAIAPTLVPDGSSTSPPQTPDPTPTAATPASLPPLAESQPSKKRKLAELDDNSDLENDGEYNALLR